MFKYNTSSEEYLCYFTDNYSTSYLKDSVGNVFSLSEAEYNVFLNSQFSQAVYPDAQPPMLITGDGESVLPTSASWSYLKQNKESVSSTVALAPSSDTTYNISGAINLHFSRTPDTCVAQIFDTDGEKIYEGTLGELSILKAQTDMLLKAKVTASWENKEGCTSHGQATYAFNILLGNKAEFSVNKTKVTSGDFVIISIKNAQSLSKIIYSTKGVTEKQDVDEATSKSIDFLYGYKPVFVTDAQFARAIIPFPAQLPAGTFEFSLAYGAAEQDFAIEIQERASDSLLFAKPSTQIAPIISNESITEFNDIVSNLKPSSQSIRFFRGQFACPTDSGLVEGYSFKDKVTSADELASFDAIGNEYMSPFFGGTPIRALNIGVVLEASYCTYLGNYVVIEHGMGLRTWYCGLSDFNVSVGDIVAKGDSIGKSGSGSLLTTDGVLILCSVYDTFISPDVLWNTTFELDATVEAEQNQ